MKWAILFIILNISNVKAAIFAKNLWPYNEIKTCFAEAEKSERVIAPYKINVQKFPLRDRLWLITWVMDEYSEKRTGIHFVGFKDCAETPDADVIIFYNKNADDGKRSPVGLHGLAFHGYMPGIIKGYPHASNFVSISTTGMKKSTVVHEFGHVAGLEHEHTHPEAYRIEKAKCSVVKKEQFKNIYTYEFYDRKSVMNYCWIHQVGKEMQGLSSGDAKTLRSLYR